MAVAETSDSLGNFSSSELDCTQDYEERELKQSELSSTSQSTEPHTAELFLASVGLQPSSKDLKEQMSEPKCTDSSTASLPPGWRKIYVRRMTGKSAGKYDAYIYSPDGRKHRSKTDLFAYLTKNGIADQYDIGDFDFTVRSILYENTESSGSCTSAQLPAQPVKKENRPRHSATSSPYQKSEGKKKSKKRKAEDDSEMLPPAKKQKPSMIENSDNATTSTPLTKRKGKKLELSASSVKKSKKSTSLGGDKVKQTTTPLKKRKSSTLPFKKPRLLSPLKGVKPSISFKSPLKIKLKFPNRSKKESESNENSSKTEMDKELTKNNIDTAVNNVSDEVMDASVTSDTSIPSKHEPINSFFSSSINEPSDQMSRDSPVLFSNYEETEHDNDRSLLENSSVEGNCKIMSEIARADERDDTTIFTDAEFCADDLCADNECNNNYNNGAHYKEPDSSLDRSFDRKGTSLSSETLQSSCQVVTARTDSTKIEDPAKEKWVPRQSPFNLMEEKLNGDTWKILVTSIFIESKESCLEEGSMPKKTVREFFKYYPTPEAVEAHDMRQILKKLKKTSVSEETIINVQKFTEEYLATNWTDPTTLSGIGSYGKDSYRIFCVNQWKQVAPRHPKLRTYHNWLWQNRRLLRLE